MSFSFPSSVVADRIGRNEPPAPWQSSKRIERLQIEDEPKEIIPSGFLYLSYLTIRGLVCRFCEFSVFRFLGCSQIARSRARARIETNMFDRNGVHAPVGRRGGVTRSAVELKYSKLRVGAASSTRVRLVDVFIKLLSGGFFVAGIGLHWLTFSMSVRIVARPDGVLSRPIGLAVSLLNRRLPFEQPSFLIGPMLEVGKNSFI